METIEVFNALINEVDGEEGLTPSAKLLVKSVIINVFQDVLAKETETLSQEITDLKLRMMTAGTAIDQQLNENKN